MGPNHWMIAYKDLRITGQGKDLLIWKKGNKERKPLDQNDLQLGNGGEWMQAETEIFKEALALYLISHYDKLLKDYLETVKR